MPTINRYHNGSYIDSIDLNEEFNRIDMINLLQMEIYKLNLTLRQIKRVDYNKYKAIYVDKDQNTSDEIEIIKNTLGDVNINITIEIRTSNYSVIPDIMFEKIPTVTEIVDYITQSVRNLQTSTQSVRNLQTSTQSVVIKVVKFIEYLMVGGICHTYYTIYDFTDETYTFFNNINVLTNRYVLTIC